MRPLALIVLAISFALMTGTAPARDRCDGCEPRSQHCEDADRCDGAGCCAPAGVAAVATQAAALAPLSPIEEAQCTEIATQRVFKEILSGDRFAVLRQEPVERRSKGGFLRTCDIEIFDYPKNAALQATIELASAKVVNSRFLKDVQPAAGQNEIAVARSFAEAEGRERLSRILLQPLEQLDITGMIRNDDKECQRHRCIEIDYYVTGADAGSVPAAEPTNAQVTWRPIKPAGRVIVDLTNITILSLELF